MEQFSCPTVQQAPLLVLRAPSLFIVPFIFFLFFFLFIRWSVYKLWVRPKSGFMRTSSSIDLSKCRLWAWLGMFWFSPCICPVNSVPNFYDDLVANEPYVWLESLYLGSFACWSNGSSEIRLRSSPVLFGSELGSFVEVIVSRPARLPFPNIPLFYFLTWVF